jgi:tetratricopeptide (TPR) repeat protein
MKKYTLLVTLVCLTLCFCSSPEKKIEEAREKDPRYQYNVGVFYLNNGQPDEAIKYLNKALALQPGFDVALDGLGLAYTMKGEFQTAASYLEKSLAVNPRLTDAHNHLGTVYQEMGMLDEAAQQFRLAVADETYHSRELPYYNLARLYYIQEKNEEAMEYVDRAILINKRLIMAHNLKGLIYERMERYQDAVLCYQAAIKLAPDEEINLEYNLASALYKNGDLERAKELFVKLRPRVADPEIKANINKYLELIEKEIR